MTRRFPPPPRSLYTPSISSLLRAARALNFHFIRGLCRADLRGPYSSRLRDCGILTHFDSDARVFSVERRGERERERVVCFSCALSSFLFSLRVRSFSLRRSIVRVGVSRYEGERASASSVFLDFEDCQVYEALDWKRLRLYRYIHADGALNLL